MLQFLLLQGVNELHPQNVELEQENQALRDRLDRIDARLAALEAEDRSPR
ncbi:MAG TPA: hypothetical protein VM370_04030 [Candidatus Thermoplasmatota archaeon]|nr:hypothetical protein [Candidatus Thermoplasmatota archaeon]